MKYLIVGLGNIGSEYAGTRHNIGFRVLDALAKASNLVFEDKRYGAVASLSLKGQQLVLLKPSTYMNLSGNAVRYWMNKENVPLERILVVVDDLALPFGALRMKPSGSDAGHNGLKNIASVLGTQAYARLRFGIGNDFPRGGQIGFVLGQFTEEDLKTMDERVGLACEMIKKLLSGRYPDYHEPIQQEVEERMNEARIDKWLWAARIFKTRSMAAAACKKGQVSMKGAQLKPSRTVKPGDVIEVRKPPVTYSFKVKQTIENVSVPS